MAAFDLATNAAPLLKRYYDDRRVYSMAFKNRPAYAWIPKKTGVVGEASGYHVPLTIDDIPGESGDFASAVSARDGDSHEVWTLRRVKRYATATLDWETVRAMKNDVGAFMRAVTPRINSGINQLSNSISIGLFADIDATNDGYGYRGVVADLPGSNVIELGSSDEARRFGLGRTIVAAATSTGAARTGSTTVTAINLGLDGSTPSITVASTAAITGLFAGDFLFVLGDTYANSKPRVLDGFNAWGPTPASVGAGETFNGVDRAKFKSKLLMLHQSAGTLASGNLTKDIRKAAAVVQANEGSPDVLFVSPTKWAEIESDLASQSRYEMMMGSDARTGFDSIVINAGGGKINIVADPWCPTAKGYMLQRNTWEFFSIDRFPDFVSDDGNRLHRLEQADQVEFRIGGYFNVCCRAPGHNAVINFS